MQHLPEARDDHQTVIRASSCPRRGAQAAQSAPAHTRNSGTLDSRYSVRGDVTHIMYELYSILFYSILFYSILFYSILFYSILFYSILVNKILILCHIKIQYIISYELHFIICICIRVYVCIWKASSSCQWKVVQDPEAVSQDDQTPSPIPTTKQEPIYEPWSPKGKESGSFLWAFWVPASTTSSWVLCGEAPGSWSVEARYTLGAAKKSLEDELRIP